MKITFLGCGASAGVPSISSGFGVCDSLNQKNIRSRSSVFIESGKTNLLIDTSPDLRWQLINNNIRDIENVLVTHLHSDHVLGFDELRQVFYLNRKNINLYSSKECINGLVKIFPHIFKIEYQYIDKDFININYLNDDQKINFKDFVVNVFEQDHFFCNSIGIRINNFAYTTDVKSFPEKNIQYLYNLDTWVVGCVRYKKSKSHFCINDVVDFVQKIKPKRTFLTHMSNEIDYCTVKNELKEYNIEPAYDGMIIDC